MSAGPSATENGLLIELWDDAARKSLTIAAVTDMSQKVPLAGPMTSLVEHNVTHSALPGEKFRQAFQFWLDAKGSQALPPQSAIVPTQLPRGTVANFSVVSVEDGPKRFRYRLLGTAIIQAWGEDLTGRFCEDVSGGAEMAARVQLCVDTRRPYYSQGPLKYAVNYFKFFAVLVMPFAGPNGEVSRLLIYNEFT